MPELSVIREGLAANLAALKGVQVSAYMLANPTPPACHVVPGETNYDTAMGRGADQWILRIQAFVAHSGDIGSQKLLDRMLASSGAQSVKAAVESDKTLGGMVDDLRVRRTGGYQTYIREGAPNVLGAEWEVEIIASGI